MSEKKHIESYRKGIIVVTFSISVSVKKLAICILPLQAAQTV